MKRDKTEFCSHCKTKRSYSEEFDSYYCEKCDYWIERICPDKKCEFCSKRPKYPSEKIIKIFKGKTKPDKYFTGLSNQPKTLKDKFGKLYEGNVRACWVNTKWGQLNVPFSWMKKKIEIVVIEKRK